MRGITDAIIEDPTNAFCRAVIELRIPVIDLHDDAPADVVDHFKYKCNDNYGQLDYRPGEMLDDFPATLTAWDTYKDDKQIKAWPSF